MPTSALVKSTTARMFSSFKAAISDSGPRSFTLRLALMISTLSPSGTLMGSNRSMVNSLVFRPVNLMETVTSFTPVWLVTPSGRVRVYFCSLTLLSKSARFTEQTVRVSPSSFSTASPPETRMVLGEMSMVVLCSLAPPP